MNPEKCQIWRRWFAGCMFIVEKKSWTKDKGNLDSWPLKSCWFPPRNHEISSVMVRFMNCVHDDIRQTFSNFYQGMVRPYHGTMPSVMFPKHVFHFCIVPSKRRVCGWLLPHISSKYLSIPCKRHENLLNGTSMVFEVVLVHPFMHLLFELELCALMPRNANNPLNTVNEPGKMSNLNTLHLRRYVDCWK